MVFSSDVVDKIKLYQEVEFHFEIAQRQRNVYQKNINDADLLKTSLVIEADFKASVVLGNNIILELLTFK